MNSPEKMNPAELAMLVGGIVVLAVAVGLLIFFVIKRRSFKPVLFLFPLAIVMIGFSSIRSVKVLGFEFDTKTANAFANDPNDAGARAGFDAELTRLDTAHPDGSAQPLSPQVRSNLVSVVTKLDRRPNLSPESRVTLARAQLLLGHTNDASRTIHSAVASNSNLEHTMDPRLKTLIRARPN
jgi:hypothetical protein